MVRKPEIWFPAAPPPKKELSSRSRKWNVFSPKKFEGWFEGRGVVEIQPPPLPYIHPFHLKSLRMFCVELTSLSWSPGLSTQGVCLLRHFHLVQVTEEFKTQPSTEMLVLRVRKLGTHDTATPMVTNLTVSNNVEREFIGKSKHFMTTTKTWH